MPPSPQDAAVSAGLDAAMAVAGRLIVYRRGGVEVSFTAIGSQPKDDAEHGEGLTQTSHASVWRFLAENLGPLGEAVPQRGDVIIEVTEAGTITWAISPKSPTDDLYWRMDRPGVWLGVYCKRAGVSP